MNLGRWPLLFHPPKYPEVNTELDAVVSHINSPADFYIQLVLNMRHVCRQMYTYMFKGEH